MNNKMNPLTKIIKKGVTEFSSIVFAIPYAGKKHKFLQIALLQALLIEVGKDEEMKGSIAKRYKTVGINSERQRIREVLLQAISEIK